MKALIYCRVSSQKQVQEGHGNDSQEKRCRDRAASKNYPVEKVFPDDGVSGGLFERPAMKALLEYIDNHPHEEYVVIFDDLSRFARDVGVHIRLKAEFKSRGVKLECLNFNFDDSEESEYAELVLAAGNQYQRKANRRQVIQKMKARLEAGYWAFYPPLGLRGEKDLIHGKILKPVEPYTSILKEAIERFRDGLLCTPQEVRLFIAKTYEEQGIDKKISQNGTSDILREILYAGYIEYPKWGISLRKAKHEGFISLETYNLVQTRLKERSKVPWVYRKDYNPIFPLRRHILCDTCGLPLTATCSHNGRDGILRPSYFCRNKQCPNVWDVIHKKSIEAEFKELLGNVKLSNDVLELAKVVFIRRWDAKRGKFLQTKNAFLEEKREIEQKISNYVERIGNTTDKSLIKIYEDEIRKLSKRIKEIELDTYTEKYTQNKFGTALEKVFEVLKKPVDMWQSDDIEDKRTILFMYFEDKLRYNHKTGFGTNQFGRNINLINDIGTSKNSGVEMRSNELLSRMAFKINLQVYSVLFSK